MNNCQGCSVRLEENEGVFLGRIERESDSARGPYCFCYNVTDEHKEDVSPVLFGRLKGRALAEAQEQCADRREGRRDAADEERGGHARQ